MKYIKNFENMKIVTEIGDYIILNKNANATIFYKNLDQKIGHIVNIENDTFQDKIYLIKYDNDNRIYYATKNEIFKSAETEEELELFLATNKYNI